MGCGTGFVKYVLFFVNLLFALGGLAILGVGVAFLLKLDVTNLLEGNIAVAPWLFIIVGGLVFIIAFFGCCGAVRESHCMVVTYAVFLLVIIIIQVILAVLVFTNAGEMEKLLANTLSLTFEKAKTDKVAQEAFGNLERQLSCCGVRGPSDYGLVVKLPDSCCSNEQGIIQSLTNLCTYADNQREGCSTAMHNFIKNYSKIIAPLAIVVACVEVIGAIFALCLANSIRNMDRRSRY